MRRLTSRDAASFAAAALFAGIAALPLGAQGSPASDADGSPRTTPARGGDPDVSAILGMNVSVSGTDRDTIGLLVSNVVRGGPADQAGVDEGNRLAAINGVSLRIDAESVGQRDASDGVFRRLARELGELRPGDDVTLRLFGGGRFRMVSLHPTVPAAPRPAPSRAVPVPMPVPVPVPTPRADDSSSPESIATVLDGLSALQAQLRRLERGEGASATLDSLTQIEQDLGAIRRRLRDLQAISERRASARSPSDDAIPGLSVSTVADDLVPYFGDGSEAGLLVLKADDSWDPLRAGDVILRINGAPATADRLRAVHDSRRSSSVEILRRKRSLTLTLDGAQQ
jgi:S1-C subfamily serine protease